MEEEHPKNRLSVIHKNNMSKLNFLNHFSDWFTKKELDCCFTFFKNLGISGISFLISTFNTII
jgi:hypothetical protein